MKPRRGEKGTDHRVSASPRRISRGPSPLITLLTDFGTADYFVAAVKGVILSSNPNARIVDLTHEIAAHDIHDAAFTLLASYKSFPKGTVHLAVVDPGVGSSRRGICVVAGEYFFVGPDNGIFSYIYEREPAFTIYDLTNKKYFREPVSSTFHGRDVFAPVAAALSKRIKPAGLGKKITDPVRLEPLAPQAASGELAARIIHIDRFGNCISNITPNDLPQKTIERGAFLVVNGKTIRSFRDYFAEPTADRAEVFCIWGSAGFLEIAAANRSAAKLLNAQMGTRVAVKSYS